MESKNSMLGFFLLKLHLKLHTAASTQKITRCLKQKKVF